MLGLSVILVFDLLEELLLGRVLTSIDRRLNYYLLHLGLCCQPFFFCLPVGQVILNHFNLISRQLVIFWKALALLSAQEVVQVLGVEV